MAKKKTPKSNAKIESKKPCVCMKQKLNDPTPNPKCRFCGGTGYVAGKDGVGTLGANGKIKSF